MARDHIRIDDRDLDELLSALRRHNRGDATRILDLWARDEREIDVDAEYDDDFDPDDFPLRFMDHDLTAWVHREVTQHVTADRFEHALCLVEAYRRPLIGADMAARITLSENAQ
jgi:hypothetical protein